MKNKTDRINQRARHAINRLTGFDLWKSEYKREMNLWDIREKTKPETESELTHAFLLMEENRETYKEILNRYSFF